jgi:RecB family endonuclease NucS
VRHRGERSLVTAVCPSGALWSACAAVIARYSVDYAGRITAQLPSTLRLLIVKADGSVLMHSDGGS